MLFLPAAVQLLLLALPSIVAAQACSTSRQQSCSTTRAMVPPGWPVFTRTRTTTLPASFITTTPTVYRTTTVAAPSVTATVSSTVILTTTSTALPGTATLFLTSTAFSTTALSTTTVTTSTTTVTTVSTLTDLFSATVPAPTGFIDAYNSSGDATAALSKRGRSEREVKRGVLDILKILHSLPIQFGAAGPAPALKHYSVKDFSNPVAVNCLVALSPVCARANPTTILVTATLPASTTTTTLLASIISTSIVIPPAVTQTIFATTITSTITQLTTVVSSALETSTSTSTSTTTSTTSVYAACATSNILGPRLTSAGPNGLLSRVLFYDSSAKVVSSTETSAYNCCVACQTSAYCQFFQYSVSSSTGGAGECFVVGQNADWCPNNQQDYSFPAYYVWDDQSKVTTPKAVGNGGCGTVMNAGQDTGS